MPAAPFVRSLSLAAFVIKPLTASPRTLDALAGSRLEDALLDDLRLLSSSARRMDGAAIYRAALVEVGQPAQ